MWHKFPEIEEIVQSYIMLDGESLKGRTEGLGGGLQGALPLTHTAPQGAEAAGFLHTYASAHVTPSSIDYGVPVSVHLP